MKLTKMKKKIKVLSDWTVDLIYKPDFAMIKKFINDEEQEKKENQKEDERKVRKYSDTDDGKIKEIRSGK
jgi:hypothetical protein